MVNGVTVTLDDISHGQQYSPTKLQFYVLMINMKYWFMTSCFKDLLFKVSVNLNTEKRSAGFLNLVELHYLYAI